MTNENDTQESNEPSVFEGTQVAVAALFDSLIAGLSINEFLEKFPTVSREQTVQVLEYFKSTIHNIRKDR